MPKMWYQSPEAVCPFYDGHYCNKIRCEGVIFESHINLVFHTASKREEYMRHHCNRADHDCMIAEMLEDKYDE